MSGDQGNAEALYSLGVCYEHGYGVNKDKFLSKQYYERSAEKGNEEAKKKTEKGIVNKIFKIFGWNVEIIIIKKH